MRVSTLKRILASCHKDEEILFSDGYSFELIPIGKGILIKKMKLKRCPKCKEELFHETNKELRKEYKWVCNKCDENFYNFEAV